MTGAGGWTGRRSWSSVDGSRVHLSMSSRPRIRWSNLLMLLWSFVVQPQECIKKTEG